MVLAVIKVISEEDRRRVRLEPQMTPLCLPRFAVAPPFSPTMSDHVPPNPLAFSQVRAEENIAEKYFTIRLCFVLPHVEAQQKSLIISNMKRHILLHLLS